MLGNYLVKGLVIGIVFGVPAGVVGVLSIQRVLTQGAIAGLMTGIGSSAADVFYACVGVFGITVISDFLLKHQSVICMAGCLMVIAIGIQTIRKSGGKRQSPSDPGAGILAAQPTQPVRPGRPDRQARLARSACLGQPRCLVSCFLSSFAVAITNPATILSFMVVFSMFRIGGTETAAENVQLVFGIFCGTCVWWIGIAIIVSMFRKRITGGFYLKLNRIFGALMILSGIVIGVRGCLLS